jgi:hypothetical protein
MEEEYETLKKGGKTYARFKSDGYEMLLSDLMAYNNPGVQYDPATGDGIISTPSRADPVGPAKKTPKKEYRFGDTGTEAIKGAFSDAADIASMGGDVTRGMLPESWQNNVPGPVLAAGDYGLAGLTGLLGLIEGGAGYAGDVVEGAQGVLGLDGRYAPGGNARAMKRDLMGMFEAAGANPESWMLGALNRRPRVNTRTPAPNSVGEAAESVYNIGDRLALPLDYRSIPGKPSVVGIPDMGAFEARPINPIEQAAREYMAARGMDTTPLAAYPRQDPARGRLIAAAYENMADDPANPAVRRAYDAMVQETIDQYRGLKDRGIEFKFLQEGMSDPYARSPAMGYRDLVENGRLWVFPTDFGYGSQTGSAFFDATKNPLLQKVGRIGDKNDAVANDAFRAVHDAYGHFGPGNPFFRAPGEERAWVEHSRMYSPEARGAMTSETRGQNSWLNFGPFAEHNKTALGADTKFAEQKIGLLDPWAWELEGMPDDEQRAMLMRVMQGWGQ